MGMDYETYINYVHQLRTRFSVWYKYKDISKPGPEGKGYDFKFPENPTEQSEAANVILAYYEPGVAKKLSFELYPGLGFSSSCWDNRLQSIDAILGYPNFSSESLREKFRTKIDKFEIRFKETESLDFNQENHLISFQEFQILLWQPLIKTPWLQRFTPEQTLSCLRHWVTQEQLNKLVSDGKIEAKRLSEDYASRKRKVVTDFQECTARIDRRLQLTYSITMNSATKETMDYSLDGDNRFVNANDIMALIFCIFRPELSQKNLEPQEPHLKHLKLLPSKELENRLGLRQASMGISPELVVQKRSRNSGVTKLSNQLGRNLFSANVQPSTRIIYKTHDANNSPKEIKFETLEMLLKCVHYTKIVDLGGSLLDHMVNNIEAGADVLAHLKEYKQGFERSDTFFDSHKALVTVSYPSRLNR